ncbi:hypothetical protein SAMN05660841_00342 [Sphingobacterium nematocida]|uniref:RelA/SpoT domain-containing protein n=1 Tax=Sphingobacterium nematocida TaxID=1513896 RepID=A0A1T5B0R4_9SPHI|nr:hypothetical protein [Sphingobacterium nematocida]SKB40647.1 hypothetical protein SAMN05660841_00342 [Sphingobacterium nematocida]
MLNIKNNIIFFEYVSTFYSDTIIEELETKLKRLKETFEELLEREADNHHLKNSSSVQDVFYFSVKGRVKDKKSFYEKLIRKNLGLHLIKELQFEGDISKVKKEKSGELSNLIKKIDDIIGIRIVTELKKDCKKVYELINNNISFFEKKNISLSNLSIQPEPMKNGLDIYKIKGSLDNIFSFELQIKSKIDEAWGDLDHTLFYKDYSVSPIKDTVQLTMNNVGFLLEKLETLLYDLRESSKKYNQVAENVKFQTEVNKKYGPQLLKLFRADVNLIEISDFILKIKERLKLKGLGKGINISFDHLSFNCTSSRLQQFQTLRSLSHKLLLIEAFYYHLKKVKVSKWNITAETYESALTEFLDFLTSYNLEGIFTELEVNKIIDDTSMYISNPALYIDKEKIKNTIDFLKLAENTLNDQFFLEHKKLVINLLFIASYEGDCSSFIDEIFNDLEPFSLSSILTEIKEDNLTDNMIVEIINDLLENIANKL